jgi:hypothetical protein
MDDVTVLLAYFQGVLTGLYTPALPVFQSKRAARDGVQRQGGFWEGQNISNGAFCLSCEVGDVVDTPGASFENITRRYPVIVEYVKRAPNASTVTDAGSGPAEVLEDPDVRKKRTAIINNLYIETAIAVPNMFDVRVKPDRTYALTGDNKTVIVSPITFFCALTNSRPGV